MQRFGIPIWRHGESANGTKGRTPHARTALLLTLPWLLLSVIVSDVGRPAATAADPLDRVVVLQSVADELRPELHLVRASLARREAQSDRHAVLRVARRTRL